jgi:hypothetical protein
MTRSWPVKAQTTATGPPHSDPRRRLVDRVGIVSAANADADATVNARLVMQGCDDVRRFRLRRGASRSGGSGRRCLVVEIDSVFGHRSSVIGAECKSAYHRSSSSPARLKTFSYRVSPV